MTLRSLDHQANLGLTGSRKTKVTREKCSFQNHRESPIVLTMLHGGRGDRSNIFMIGEKTDLQIIQKIYER